MFQLAFSVSFEYLCYGSDLTVNLLPCWFDIGTCLILLNLRMTDFIRWQNKMSVKTAWKDNYINI